MSWTKINKPSASNWQGTNPQGREQYNQSNLTYDDSSVFYDGVNPNQWTKVSKPVSQGWTKVSKPI